MNAILHSDLYEMVKPKQFSVALGPMRAELEKFASYYDASMARMLLVAGALGMDVLRAEGDAAWLRGVRLLREMPWGGEGDEDWPSAGVHPSIQKR